MREARRARLFLLVYLVGVLVTVFLSNDATAVVLTPAVFAATQAAKADKPLPYLFVCAFVANAASFVLPISNPANLVVYGGAHAAAAATGCRVLRPALARCRSSSTYASLRCRQRRDLAAPSRRRLAAPPLIDRRASWRPCGIAATALRAARRLGARSRRSALPTLVAGRGDRRCWSGRSRAPRRCRCCAAFPGACCRWSPGCSCWSRRSTRTGVIARSRRCCDARGASAVGAAAAGAGVVAFARNLVNNLPAGLVAASAAASGARARPPSPRRADRRRSRPQPLGHRLARDHPLAGRDPPRRAQRPRPAIFLVSGLAVDAAGAGCGAGGGVDVNAGGRHAEREHALALSAHHPFAARCRPGGRR